MKRRFLLSSFVFFLLIFFFYAASSGVAVSQNRDRTGSPLTSGSCATCHSGGNFDPSISVEVLDDDVPVTTYEPGKTYSFKVTINASNNPAGYGFQAVALKSDTTNAGDFGTPPADTRVTTLNNLKYFEQSTRSATNSWSVDWIAPDAGAGDVRFYASGNAVNGADGISGDSPASLDSPFVLMEDVASSTVAVERLDLQMKVFPNPVQNVLNLEMKGAEEGRLQLSLINGNGQVLQNRQLEHFSGYTNQELDVQHLPAGFYNLLVSDGEKVNSIMVVKK